MTSEQSRQMADILAQMQDFTFAKDVDDWIAIGQTLMTPSELAQDAKVISGHIMEKLIESHMQSFKDRLYKHLDNMADTQAARETMTHFQKVRNADHICHADYSRREAEALNAFMGMVTSQMTELACQLAINLAGQLIKRDKMTYAIYQETDQQTAREFGNLLDFAMKKSLHTFAITAEWLIQSMGQAAAKPMNWLA